MHPTIPPSLCMVCGEERPDELIEVHKRPSAIQMPSGWPGDAMGELQVNVRYCLDRPRCVEVAHEQGPWPGWGGGYGHPLHDDGRRQDDEPGDRTRSGREDDRAAEGDLGNTDPESR